MPRSSNLDSALEWAAAGYHVFPCVEDGKVPACANGVHDATRDPDKIRALWHNSSFNIGVAPALSGMSVVDVDPPLGESNLREVEAKEGKLPGTFTVRTPRGGLHYWFQGVLPSTAGKICPNVDTRSAGGYVLVPPSIVKGNPYVIEDDSDIAFAPEWIRQRLTTSSVATAAVDVELDSPGSIARARALLEGYAQRGHVAVEGCGGDSRTYAVACEVLNLGLSPEKALELLAEIWNPHCQPEWDLDALEAKVSNASEYAQNDAGAWAVEPVAEVFAAFAKLETTPKRSRFQLLDEAEQDRLSDPTWLVPNMIPDESIVLMYGPSGEYKSFLALDIALHLASGVKGYTVEAHEKRQVVYVAAEGARAIVRKRRPAWRIAKSVNEALPFFAVDTMPLVARPDEIIAFCEAVKGRGVKPKLVILDTLARGMAGLNENDAKDAGIFIEAIECIKRTFSCSVLVLHHTGKEESRGARGSSALFAGFDTVLSVSAHKGSKCVELRVRKQKDADEAEDPWLYQGQMVGPSLVFHQITSQEYKKATAEDDQFSRQKIGALLRKLNAVGKAKGVPTRVLATELCEGHSHSEVQVASAEKRLRKRAKDVLEAYQENGIWFLPAQEQED